MKKNYALVLLTVILLLSLLGTAFAFKDFKEFKELRKAAEKGDVEAQYKLGWVYYTGTYEILNGDFFEKRPVSKNRKQALFWLSKAAEQGHLSAQSLLSGMYYSGKELTEQNYEKAFEYTLNLAERGDIRAEYRLGGMYENGEGVTADKQKAVEWYKKVAFSTKTDLDSKITVGRAQEALKRLGIEANTGINYQSQQYLASLNLNQSQETTTPIARNNNYSVSQTNENVSNKTSKVPMPQLQEIDNILAFLNQPLPKLMNGNNFDVVSYNIRLLVSYAKPKEALAYAQKNARVFTVNPAEDFYKYLQDIIDFDNEFHRNLNRVLQAKNNRDHHGLVASLQAISNMNYDIGLSSYYTHGIELNKAVAVYSNLIKDVEKSLNQAVKYRDAVVAENNASIVKDWGGFTGTQKTPYGSSPSEYTDFLSNFDNLCENGSVQEFNKNVYS